MESLEKKSAEAVQKKRILIADDESRVRVLMRKVLEKHFSDVEVAEACDGLEALRLIEEGHAGGKPFGLVITDMVMPGMTGGELLAKVRHNREPGINNLPVVLNSGSHSANDVLKEYGHAPNDTISKPFTVDDLVSKVRAHLHLKQNNSGKVFKS